MEFTEAMDFGICHEFVHLPWFDVIFRTCCTFVLKQQQQQLFTVICPGLPEWASTRRNIRPPTILIMQSLSASSIYYDPQHSPCSMQPNDNSILYCTVLHRSEFCVWCKCHFIYIRHETRCGEVQHMIGTKKGIHLCKSSVQIGSIRQPINSHLNWWCACVQQTSDTVCPRK